MKTISLYEETRRAIENFAKQHVMDVSEDKEIVTEEFEQEGVMIEVEFTFSGHEESESFYDPDYGFVEESEFVHDGYEFEVISAYDEDGEEVKVA